MAKTAKIDQIARDVRYIKDDLVEKVPRHFTMKHVIGSVFGALVFGLTFAIKGLLLDVTEVLTENHIRWILFSIAVALSGAIYYIGYARVKHKETRKFGQFWAKRFTAYVLIGFGVSYLLVNLYGINILTTNAEHLRNTVIALALPCCIGATISDLLKQY